MTIPEGGNITLLSKEICVFIIATSQVVIDEFLGHFFFKYNSMIFNCDILFKTVEINWVVSLSVYVCFLVLYYML